MEEKTQKPLAKKQVAIIQSAEELFMQFGFKKVTIEDICQKAGASKMTFYKYFKNKNELILFMTEKMFEEGMEKFREIEKSDLPFTEKLQAILKMKAESSARISKEFAQEYFYANPEIKKIMDKYASSGMEEFINFLKRAQEKGEVRKSLRPEFFLAVINSLRELAKNDQLISLYPNYQDFVMEFNNFIFYGLMPNDK